MAVCLLHLGSSRAYSCAVPSVLCCGVPSFLQGSGDIPPLCCPAPRVVFWIPAAASLFARVWDLSPHAPARTPLSPCRHPPPQPRRLALGAGCRRVPHISGVCCRLHIPTALQAVAHTNPTAGAVLSGMLSELLAAQSQELRSKTCRCTIEFHPAPSLLASPCYVSSPHLQLHNTVKLRPTKELVRGPAGNWWGDEGAASRGL